MNRTSTLTRWRRSLGLALAAVAVHGSSGAADIDIYASSGSGAVPNVMFFLDNTSNWSRQQQAWFPDDSWNKCKDLDADAVKECKAAIEAIFYIDKPANAKRPWENGFKKWTSSEAPPQGVVELRAIRFVLKAMVCDVVDDPNTAVVEKPLAVNVGLSLFTPDKGSARNNSDAVAIIYHAVKRLTGPSNTGTCKALLDKLDVIDKNINAPTYKAPSDADYSAAFYEIFKYFGGYTNPTLAAGAVSTPGSPVGGTGYGDTRFSKVNTLDDPDAFDDSSRATYKSPISSGGACGNNYLVLVGNTYPNAEPNAGPVRFQGLNYTPPSLGLGSDTTRFADEWSYFLSNTDVNEATGTQRVFTYAMNVYNDKEDLSQTRLLRSIAGQGGVGGSGYVQVGGDLYKLVNAFKGILLEVAAVDSVFTATTLPVSTTTQGTYLNQVFVGMFRPDAQFNPRWVGNVKLYELGLINGSLELVDAKKNSVVLESTGFFRPQAESFWTESSVFFENLKSGSPPSASDLPDGSIVEKGGVAQQLRISYLTGAGSRSVYTLPTTPPAAGTSLKDAAYAFTSSNSSVSSTFTAAEVAWVRGEANLASGPGAEEFVGAFKDNAGVITNLGTTGARHSIHGDVLHSRPVAINYGTSGVVVYYGANDGFLRAIDGNKDASAGGGDELWSFIAPEHYAMLKRQRAGTPLLHLPETNSEGKLEPTLLDAEPKNYAFDGPIGSYVLYNSGSTAVTEAMIYASMRRGGKAVYAFDVTNKADPKFKWKIDSSGSFSDLAQTWSMAKPIVYKAVSGAPPVVVMMGGGYDVAEETNEGNKTGTPAGNRVYFINGRTGALLTSVRTDFSVAADVTVVDVTLDGRPDRAYAVDVRGNVYRIDLPATGDVLDPTTWNGTTAVKIAKLGGKVFYAADVVVTEEFVAVLVGTGDREKPLLTSKIWGDGNAEGFFMIKDTKVGLPPPATPFEPKDLSLIARVNKDTMRVESVAPDANLVKNGCYMTLAENGEKVVNAPTTIGGVAYFGTNRPTPGDSLSCRASLGEAYAYRFPLFCKTPNNTKLATGGLPPSPVAGVVLIDGKKVPFIIGGGTRGSSFSPEEPKPAVSPVRQRQFWYIDNRNR
jgi:type IV pilus assembly protein PilY1